MVSRCVLMLCLLVCASFLQETTSRSFPEADLDINGVENDMIGEDISEEDSEDLPNDESPAIDDEIILDGAGGIGGIGKEGGDVEYVSEEEDKAMEEEDKAEEEADAEGEGHDGETDDMKVEEIPNEEKAEEDAEKRAEEVEVLESEMEEEKENDEAEEAEAEEDAAEESQEAGKAFEDADAEDSDDEHSGENSEEGKNDYHNGHAEGTIKFTENGEEGHGGLDGGSEEYGLPKRFYYKVKHFLKGIFSG